MSLDILGIFWLVSTSLDKLVITFSGGPSRSRCKETLVRFPTGHVARRRNAFLLLGLVLVVVGAVFALPKPVPVAALVSSGLPTSYQSAAAELRQQELPTSDVAPAIVVYSHEDGSALTEADKTAITARASALRIWRYQRRSRGL